MSSQLYIGNSQATPSVVVEKQVPMPLSVQKTKDANNKLSNSGTNIIDLTGITDINNYVLAYEYYNNNDISGEVNFSSLQTISGNGACYSTFYDCKNITKANLSNLTTVSGSSACYYMFYNCTGLTSIDLSNLEVVGNNSYGCASMFENCKKLESADLSKLKKITGYEGCARMFQGCTKLLNVDLRNLEFISGAHGIAQCCWECNNLISVDLSKLTTVINFGLYRFLAKCSKIETVSVPSLKFARGQRSMNQFLMWAYACKSVFLPALDNDPFGNALDALSYFAQSINGCTIHFPKNLDPQTGNTAISSQETYPYFDGYNTVLAFDLPSTYHLIGINSQEYERNPKDDTVTALAWRKKDLGTITEPIIDWTPYYTSTLNDPQVGDTIYSDPECTQAVTTINSIS